MSLCVVDRVDLSRWIRSQHAGLLHADVTACLDAIDLDPERPEWAQDAARWTEYLRHIDVYATVLELELTRRAVACECGAILGRQCPWLGHYKLTRLVRYVPDSLHAVGLAGGAGVAGALARVGQLARCSAECTEEVVHIWCEGARTADRNPFVEILPEGVRR